jgi:predicted nucleic acid-binding protein
VTRIIVDASVLVACALADGSSRRTLLQATGVEFYAPQYVLDELRRKTPKLLALSGVPPIVLTALIDDLVSRVVVLPYRTYAGRMDQALKLTAAAHAEGDEDYVALALTLNAPIWTCDKDFRRIRGVKVIRRAEIRLERPKYSKSQA